MKKYTSISACLSALLLAVSCAFEEKDVVPSAEKCDVVLTASLEVPEDDTRTSLSSDNKVLWSAGDAFALLSSASKDRFELTSGAGTAEAAFAGTVSAAGPFYALYPYSDACAIEGGNLKFQLPQEQGYVNSNFAAGASPAVATLSTLDDALHFKNLCGILQLNICGSGKMAGIEVVNLDGRPLWGDCTLALDGKQGTSEQNMTITGGSNMIKVTFSKAIPLPGLAPRVVNIVVPVGSFTKGFSVRVFDTDSSVRSFLTVQKETVKVARSFITSMDKVKVPANGEPRDVMARGYYCDVFMDGSLDLSSRTTLPACPYLGLSLEYIATSSGDTSTDTLMTKSIFGGWEDDPNGVLLYPDGEPRYRCIYVNGGSAGHHGNSLGEAGRKAFKTFVSKGGSYVGSCAGAFLACTGTHSRLYNQYLGVYPGICTNCSLQNTYTDIFIEPNSPLLNYYDFGGDLYVEHVYHNGGCFMSDEDLVPGAEILCRYAYEDSNRPGNGKPVIHKQGCAWAYKGSATSGRVIPLGSHPEGVSSGESLDMFAAIIHYAIDGNGDPSAKATLYNGSLRKQTNRASATLAPIGDGQYHHFMVQIPEGGARNFKIELESDLQDYNLHLSMRKGDFAWRSEADFCLAQAGSNKTLEIDSLAAGEWYVSVYCATLPTSNLTNINGCRYFAYEGQNAGIEGVPYTIRAIWE